MQNYSSGIHFMEDFFIFHSTGKNLRLQAEPLQPPPQSCYDGTWEGESGKNRKGSHTVSYCQKWCLS